jgi:hypothetical protein
MNTPVSFPLAKLLKEKGFDKPCNGCYDEKGIYGFTVMSIKQYYANSKEDTWNFAAPTVSEVIMWLYEKHGIWVSVDWMKRIKPYNSGFYCHLRGTNKSLNRDNFIVINDTLNPGYEVFNSPTEAYEDAIEYILNNLI